MASSLGLVLGAAASPVWTELLAGLIVKSTLLLLVAAFLAVVLRRASAASRHLVWSVAVGSLLALPVLSAVLPNWTLPWVPALAAVEQVGSEVMLPPPAPPAPVLYAEPFGSAPAIPLPPPVPAPADPALAVSQSGWTLPLGLAELHWTTLLFATWGAGMLLILCWLLIGQWGVRRLSQRAEPLADAEWDGLLRDLVWMLDINRPVRLLRSDRATMPLTWGITRPIVLLPAAADAWPEDQRRVVLLHELAHVKRHDCLTQLLAQIACTLFWFHPGVWYAARRLRVERERACDDLVLGLGTRASDYAGYLLEVARLFRTVGTAAPVAVSMARPSQLEGRLLAVLDPSRRRGIPSPRLRASAVVGSFLLVLPLAAMQPDSKAEAAPGGVLAGIDFGELDAAAHANPKHAFHESGTVAVTGEALESSVSHAEDFRWSGRIAQGRTLEIWGTNGNIQALPASGDVAEVTATKRARRSNPDEVRIEVIEHARGVTICAVYPTPRGARRPNQCQPGDGGQSTSNNDVNVNFTVRVPAGVQFVGRGTNGNLTAEGLRSHIDARTTNGNVRLSTTGHAQARTTNGSINATLGSAAWNGEAVFRSTNGSITLHLPADASTEVRASTTNGTVQSDFPLQVGGGTTVSRRQLSGTIGRGGRQLTLQSTNGTIRILQAGARSDRSTRTGAGEHAAGILNPEELSHEIAEAMSGLGDEITHIVTGTVTETVSAVMQGLFGGSNHQRKPSREPTDVLIRRLNSEPDPEVRRQAAWALARSERAAVNALAQSVRRDRDAEVREMAAWSLGQLRASAAAPAVPALQEALRSDRASDVRFTALWSLEQIGRDAVAPAIPVAAADRSKEIRQRAIWLAGSEGMRTQLPTLTRALADTNAEIRTTAAWSLGMIGDRRAVDPLRTALRDENSDVRKAALWALVQIDDDRARSAVASVAAGGDQEIRGLAMNVVSGGPWPWPWPWPIPRPRPVP